MNRRSEARTAAKKLWLISRTNKTNARTERVYIEVYTYSEGGSYEKRVLSLFMALALCFSPAANGAALAEEAGRGTGRRKCQQHLHHR